MASPTLNPIELSLFAPYNEEVALLASFTDWKRVPMTKGKDGWWRITPKLADGDYLYKFAVKSKSYFAMDQWIEVFDPYALSITDDEKENTHLSVRRGKRRWIDYQWQHDDHPLMTNDQLIIYELHVGDFSGGKGDEAVKRPKGKFNDVTEKLDYLSDLGITAIELMPVKEFPAKSWGYNLRSLFAVDSGYGSPADLCRLIDECHGRGIRVIIDGVYNHAEAEAPLAKIHYEYWFYRNNPDPDYLQWGPKFNYEHYDTNLKLFPARKYVIESIEFWIEKFHVDGIRFDATRAVKDFKLMREFTDAAFKKIGGLKQFFTVAEHIPEDPAIVGYPNAGPMVATWHESFAKQLQAIATRHERDGMQPWDLDGLERLMDPKLNGFGTGNHVVNYITTHDQEQLMSQIGRTSLTFGEAAFRRAKLATALLLTSPGLPMLWMGQEIGVAVPKSMDPHPIDWALLANPTNNDLRQFTAALVKLRRNSPTLRSDNYQTILKDPSRHLFGYKRWDDAGGMVAVVCNLEDTDAGEFTIADVGLLDGDWHEWVYNFDMKISGGVLKYGLGPSEVKIFIKK